MPLWPRAATALHASGDRIDDDDDCRRRLLLGVSRRSITFASRSFSLKEHAHFDINYY